LRSFLTGDNTIMPSKRKPRKPKPWAPYETLCDISDCQHYRYSLQVTWGTGHILVVVGLNPSTADGKLDDWTARKCVDWAIGQKGYGGLLLLNAYAFRDKSPAVMIAEEDPFGGQTVEKIVEMCGRNRVIAAWGTGARHKDRGMELSAAFARAGVPLECWGVNKTDGSPKQPSRIGIGDTEEWPRKPSTAF
jgi:hypothetical protein